MAKAAKKKAPTPKKAAKAAPAAKPAKINPATKARSKSEVYGIIAEHNGLTRKQVGGIFDTVGKLIASDLDKAGPGVFNVPGLMKVTVVRKQATKARKGINPFTKEEVMFKAKPARNVVKIRALKGLKDLV